MKLLLVILYMICMIAQSLSQNTAEMLKPVPVISATHEPDYLHKYKKLPTSSFYQSKTEWQAIIDSTWGAGDPLAKKLEIFDTYTKALDDKFDGFLSLGLDWASWDSLKNNYRSQINDSTSKGRFCALMNYLVYELRDMHTVAYDKTLLYRGLSPGTPFLCAYGFWDVKHFGAVGTALPDCTTLILRVVDNHPLGLQPGDIILGYEGIPYSILLKELLDAQLPALLPWAGARSAECDNFYKLAGMNWHLFDTIDILQFSTGDTLHLSVAPMINLHVPSMLNNEQMAIPGIPFPGYFNQQVVSYGVVENTSIGYIYLFSEDNNISIHPDIQFYEAVNVLQNTKGLIIDMRWNEGGWAFFSEAFKILFNKSDSTLNSARRCQTSSFDLCPAPFTTTHKITGDPKSIYDHPIAILLGPNCVSMGDRTAHRFRYHPMVSFFGKPPASSFGLNEFIESYPNWFLRYSIEDLYHVNQPGIYLNRSEFPIDFPVWFNPEDVAKGEDTVVKRALEWMQNLAYAHDVAVNKTYAKPGMDTVIVTAQVENSKQHKLSVKAAIKSTDDAFIDSLTLYDDGMHGDGAADDKLWGNYHTPVAGQSVTFSVTTKDITEGTSRTLPHVSWYTTIGPVQLDAAHPYIETGLLSNGRQKIKLILYNADENTTAKNITATISTQDPRVEKIQTDVQRFNDIIAGVADTSNREYLFVYAEGYGPEDIQTDPIEFDIEICRDDYPFWIAKFDFITGIESNYVSSVPFKFSLSQNYPNPFNPSTTINYQLPMACNVELSIYNLLGQKVATLVSKKQPAGQYQVEWDASNFASGIYYYMIKAGEFRQVKKMVLIR
jgi:hypothetical protein